MAITETELIASALNQIKSNPRGFISKHEWISIDADLRGKWYELVSMQTKLCEICLGRTCNVGFDVIDRFIPCPYGTQEIIAITEEDRVRYRFKREFFLQMIQEQFEIMQSVVHENGYDLLGVFLKNDDKWQILFVNNTLLSFGSIIEMRLKHPASFSLIILDEMTTFDDYDYALYLSFGIFFATWDQKLNDVIDSIYFNELSELSAIRHLQQTKGLSTVLNETLLKTATDGKGTPFEKAVYSTIKSLFNVAMPFGGNYSGFSVPDGLFLDATRQPYPTIFYDCKSFIGDNYIHKAEIAMQANYYEGFLRDFYEKSHYKRTGFAIFASSFPRDVQKQITGSSQWKYVFEHFKIFFIDISFLQRSNSLLEEFGILGDQINKSDLMRFCFEDDISKMSYEVQGYYCQLFDQSALANYRFLNGDNAELGIITALLNRLDEQSDLEALSKDLKNVIRASKHDNLNKRVKRPVISSFLNHFIAKAKDNTIFNHLHPLSVLEILNRNDDELESQLDDLYDKIYAASVEKVKHIISNRC